MTAAILLAGGRASRLGGVDKPLLEIGGRTLLARAVDAAAACAPIVVVGPQRAGVDGVVWVREDPPFGGPVAAVAAALPHVDAESVLVLATDLPRVEEAVPVLAEAAALLPPGDGVCLADESGRPQWLIGRYRTRALRERAERLPVAGASFRDLVAELAISVVRAHEGVVGDVDTWQDLERARGEGRHHDREQ